MEIKTQRYLNLSNKNININVAYCNVVWTVRVGGFELLQWRQQF